MDNRDIKPIRDKRTTNEIRAHEWMVINSLWRRVCPLPLKDQANQTDQADMAEKANLVDKAKEVDAFLKDSDKTPLTWETVNKAETMVGEYLDAINIKQEFESLLYTAKSRNAEYYQEFQQKLSLFDDLTGDKLKICRTIYLDILYRLQSDFINTRFSRRLRRETSKRLIAIGVVVIAICLIPVVVTLPRLMSFDVGDLGSKLSLTEPYFALTTSLTLGILGSYFSRVLNFNSVTSNFGFETADSLYSVSQLALRLLYGMIGASVLYFLIWSGLIGGEMFPQLEETFATIEPGQFPDTAARESGRLTEFIFLKPNAELAKLMIWSFIAGFSERFVPDSLGRVEGKASSEG